MTQPMHVSGKELRKAETAGMVWMTSPIAPRRTTSMLLGGTAALLTSGVSRGDYE